MNLNARRRLAVTVLSNWAVGLACLAVVVGGVACYVLGRRWWGDIPFLWATRDIRPGAPPYSSRFLEYPAVVGTSLWLVSFVAKSAVATYAAFLAVGTALAGLTTATLRRVNPKGTLFWAGSPLLAVYGAHNFELLAIAPSTIALVGIESGASFIPGVLLAFGTWAKIYPIVFLACAIVLLLTTAQGHRLRPLLLGFVAATIALNAGYIIASFDGWLEAFRFHGRRLPSWGTVWFYLVHDPRIKLHLSVHDTLAVINVLSTVVAGTGLAAVLFSLSRRRCCLYEHACMALIVFLLANKVYSPQYDLWLVPLLVLVRVSAVRWLVLTVVSGTMFLVVFSRVPHSPLLRTYVVGTLAFVRAGAELALFRFCWRRARETARSAERTTSFSAEAANGV